MINYYIKKTKLSFYFVLYDSMLHYNRIKKITHEHFSGFTDLCILNWNLLLNLSGNWSIKSLFVEFRP